MSTPKITRQSRKELGLERDDEIDIDGVPVEVVDDEEAEKVDFVVCCYAGVWSPFGDNVSARCGRCDEPIFHRPHVPKTPVKICIQCATDMAGDVN